ncbi:MAG: cytochrome c, 6 heme-binding site [Deltaproteobacteria bacterium]|jgi:c(7)-type cytochrome triheme protein|nr:cytochrome c, 6 heme-binding site [Deltaproteobacteria bacterium]
MRLKIFLSIILVLTLTGAALGQTGVKKKRPLPADFGRVVLNNHAAKAGLAPVVFDHWSHRSWFTCRVCHVDLTFGMKTGSTGVSAADNMKGFYCGACHNGKMSFQGRKVFESCAAKDPADGTKRCDRCHSLGKQVRRDYDFATYTARFPKERFGNGIDWEKAEDEGYIKPVDVLEGTSTPRKSLSIQKDFALGAKLAGMPDIIFSHKKHTVWNGCELCHPEIFAGVTKGTTKYSMVDIFEGRYCGACHTTVAFPLLDCQRCHTRPVQTGGGKGAQ